MLMPIKNTEVKPVSEFRRQYADKWFRYIVIEPRVQDSMIRVIHIADSKEEIYSASDAEYQQAGFTHFGVDWGANVNPEPIEMV